MLLCTMLLFVLHVLSLSSVYLCSHLSPYRIVLSAMLAGEVRLVIEAPVDVHSVLELLISLTDLCSLDHDTRL